MKESKCVLADEVKLDNLLLGCRRAKFLFFEFTSKVANNGMQLERRLLLLLLEKQRMEL